MASVLPGKIVVVIESIVGKPEDCLGANVADLTETVGCSDSGQ